MDYAPASQPEILRANQKDEEYSMFTKAKLLEALDMFIPSVFSYRTMSNNPELLKLVADLLYYGICYLGSTKTLGEEYSYILPYDGKNMPFLWKRRIMLIGL